MAPPVNLLFSGFAAILVSLRSYVIDGYGNENDTIKDKFSLTDSYVFCYYSVLVKLHKIVEVHFRLLDTSDFHLKAKNERFTAAGSWRCRQHLKYEKCTSLFGRVRHKLRQKAYRTCSNIIFPHSTNQFFVILRQKFSELLE